MHIFSVTVEWVEISVRGTAVNLKNNSKVHVYMWHLLFCITDL